MILFVLNASFVRLSELLGQVGPIRAPLDPRVAAPLLRLQGSEQGQVFTEGNQRNLTKHACQSAREEGGHFPGGKRNVSRSAELTGTGAKDTV